MRVLLTGVRRIDEFSVRTALRLDALKNWLPLRVRTMPHNARKALDAVRDIRQQRGPSWLKWLLDKRK
jgi:hypothetical protein